MTTAQIYKTIRQTMVNQGKSPVSIAKELQRHPSTIRRWLNSKGKIRMSKLYLLLDQVGLKLVMVKRNK